MQNGKVSYLLCPGPPRSASTSQASRLEEGVCSGEDERQTGRAPTVSLRRLESDDVIMPGDYMLYKGGLKAKGGGLPRA